MYSQNNAAMAPPQKPETFMLSDAAQQSLPQDAQVALQQVDNREYIRMQLTLLFRSASTTPLLKRTMASRTCADGTPQSNTSSYLRLWTGRLINIFGDSYCPLANTCRASCGKMGFRFGRWSAHQESRVC